MGRRPKADDPATLHSIALLQKRFRQLERTKEMREERDLLRAFAAAQSEPPNSSQPARYEQPKWFLHTSRSLQLCSDIDRSMQLQDCENWLSIGLRSHRANKNVYSPKMPKEKEVDTSLHL